MSPPSGLLKYVDLLLARFKQALWLAPKPETPDWQDVLNDPGRDAEVERGFAAQVAAAG